MPRQGEHMRVYKVKTNDDEYFTNDLVSFLKEVEIGSPIRITATEMSEEDFNNLKEFEG